MIKVFSTFFLNSISISLEKFTNRVEINKIIIRHRKIFSSYLSFFKFYFHFRLFRFSRTNFQHRVETKRKIFRHKEIFLLNSIDNLILILVFPFRSKNRTIERKIIFNLQNLFLKRILRICLFFFKFDTEKNS